MHIHIKIILPNVTSYVMALKTKKVWYVRLIFFRVKKKCDETMQYIELIIKGWAKIAKII